jgi:uncharacterized protein YkwD
MRALRTAIRALLAVCLAACAHRPIPVSGSPSGAGGAGSGKPTSSGTVAADIVAYTNDARARNGLPPLASNPKLMEAARIHAEQMAQYQRMDHVIVGAPYPTLQSRLQAARYAYSSAAENVAWNQADARSVVNGWMGSSGHRSNILDTYVTEMGAAMARDSKGQPYWIQVFGHRR